jgi:hypothetical protein
MSVRNTVKSIQDIMRQDSGVDGDAQRISQLCWMFFLKIIDDQDQELELLQDKYISPVPQQLRWSSWAANPEGITGEALLESRPWPPAVAAPFPVAVRRKERSGPPLGSGTGVLRPPRSGPARGRA